MMLMPQPKLMPVPSQNLWCNCEDFYIESRGNKICVPEFFLFDGASIPILLWAVIAHPFDPKVVAAALVHDWQYWSHQYDRDEVDLMFLDLLLLNGADPAKAKAMYMAVSGFGESYWNNDEDDKTILRNLYILKKDSPNFKDYHFPEGVWA